MTVITVPLDEATRARRREECLAEAALAERSAQTSPVAERLAELRQELLAVKKDRAREVAGANPSETMVGLCTRQIERLQQQIASLTAQPEMLRRWAEQMRTRAASL